MLESLQDQVWQAVAESRDIDSGALDALADRAPLLRDDAVASGLVDRIGFRDEAYARIAEMVGVEGVSPEADDSTDDAAPALFDALRRRGPVMADPAGAVGSRPPVQAHARRDRPSRARSSTAWRAAVPAVRHLFGRRRHDRGGTARGGRRRFGVRDRAEGGQSRAVRSPRPRPSGARWPGPRTRQTGGGVDGFGCCLWRLLRRDGRRRDRGQSGHHHRLDWCLHRKTGGSGSQGSAGSRGQIPCAPTPMPTPGRSTRRSPPQQQAYREAEADLYYADFVERVAARPQPDHRCRGCRCARPDLDRRRCAGTGSGRRTRWTPRPRCAGPKSWPVSTRTPKCASSAYPGSSLLDMVRPRASSQPAAASLPDALGRAAGPLGARQS